MHRLLKTPDGEGTSVSPRRPRPPRAVLERLVAQFPSRVRDRTLDAAESAVSVAAPPSQPATVEVTCWTPMAGPSPDPEPRTTLLADPAAPGGTDAPVSHTLVLEVDAPTRSVAVDYRSLDAAVVPDHGVHVRTDDGDPVAVSEARVAGDGTFEVTLAEPRTDGALFVEYAVTRNPSGGRHTVGVVVNGARETEARLVVVG